MVDLIGSTILRDIERERAVTILSLKFSFSSPVLKYLHIYPSLKNRQLSPHRALLSTMTSSISFPLSSPLRAPRDHSSSPTFSLARTCALRNDVILRGSWKPYRRGNSRCIFAAASAKAVEEEEEEEETSPFTVLSYVKSQYNEIMVVDTPTSRVLLLDDTREHDFPSVVKFNSDAVTSVITFFEKFYVLFPIMCCLMYLISYDNHNIRGDGKVSLLSFQINSFLRFSRGFCKLCN